MAKKLDLDKPIFVIEQCNNCRIHQWNTRLDENKYNAYSASLTSEIQANVGNATILINQVPKEWAMADIYCQLIPNDDENNDVYDIMPRMYAFEVSTRPENGSAFILYSKIMALMWPHYVSLGKRIGSY